jgi:hypothetical protein
MMAKKQKCATKDDKKSGCADRPGLTYNKTTVKEVVKQETFYHAAAPHCGGGTSTPAPTPANPLVFDSSATVNVAGAGTLLSPYTFSLASGLLPAPITGANFNQCGYNIVNGIVKVFTLPILSVTSSDLSVNVSSGACGAVDLTLPAAAVVLDPPAEIAIIKATTASVLGIKTVTVTINNDKAGATGVITITPNVGAPQSTNYTAAANGSATATFTIDPTATSVTVSGMTSSTRILINPQATFNLSV